MRDAARAGQSHESAPGQPLQVAGVDRRIGGDHDHTGAILLFLQLIPQIMVAQPFADRHAFDLKYPAEIRLHQHPYGVPAQSGRQFARGSTDAALVAETDGSGAGADTTLGDRARCCYADGLCDMCGGHMPAADIVESPVVGFADDGIDGLHFFVARLREGVIQHTPDPIGHGERIGQDHRRFETAQFL